MKKVAVIYWSQTGNTQQMAQLIAQGALEGGAQVECMPVSSLTPEQALEYDGLALGCPAMGAEVLEEAEFDPFFTQLEGHLQEAGIVWFLWLGGRRVDALLAEPVCRGRGLSRRR